MLTRPEIEKWLKESAENRIISITSKMWRDRTVAALTELEKQVSGWVPQPNGHPLSLVMARDYADQRARWATEAQDQAHEKLRSAEEELAHTRAQLAVFTDAKLGLESDNGPIDHVRDIF